MKTILILGSKGQIGKYLSNYLKKKKFNIINFDLTNSKKEDLRIHKNKKLISSINKSDFIFFLAFDVGGARYLKKYQKTYSFLINNIKIMQNTFEEIYKRKKNFIFASSQMSNMSYSSYGVLKKIGEDITSSLGGISVRFWNVYGVEENLEKSHVITDFIIKGFKNKKIRMLTNGEEKRDFLYAEDCCSGLEVIMNKFNKFKSRKYIDLNYGKTTKILDIAKILKVIFKENGIKIKLIKGKSFDDIQKNKLNIASHTIHKYWKPKFDLKEGINKIFNYYFSRY
jgi:nucleoside-diphosphate-sugar epimerase